jgi:integrase
MSSVHADRGWLFVAFRLMINGRTVQVRLYPNIRDTRDGRRSPLLKDIRELIQFKRWAELAVHFPRCKHLQPFRALDPDRTTFRVASERFLAHQANVNQPATVRFYRNPLHAHIWPSEIADKPLKIIGPSDIAALIAPLQRSGRRDQAAKIKRTVAAVFNWARGEHADDGEYLVIDNPANRIRNPRGKSDHDIDPFTPDEIKAILANARAPVDRRIITVAFGAGLDPGENFGLKIADIDFAERKIKIRQRYTRFGVGPVKNARRAREVDMIEPVCRALREQVGKIELRSPWLWARGPQGLPYNPQNFSRRAWKAALKQAGVKHRRFYQCRHTFATLLLKQGAEWRYIADQMGHTNIDMLTKVYWRWQPGKTIKPDIDLLKDLI